MQAKGLALFVALTLTAGALQFHYDTRVEYFADREAFLALPDGNTLKVLSFGYRNLVADVLFIWAIQFYSATHLTNRFDYVENIFNVITDLNPRFKAPYLVGSWIMGLEGGRYRMAIRLLEKGARNNPEEWIFEYDAGFYAYRDLKDLELAEKLFRQASERPNAPPLIRRKWAHMVYMQDNLDYAFQLWKEFERTAKDQLARDSAFHHLYQIDFERDRQQVEKAVREYRRRFGRTPADLEELRLRGLLREIPRDYQGREYRYQRESGTIRARRNYKWKSSY
ncbi:MAG: hypothetical protein RB296_07335 [Acidobacteriota bacterium]|jgi:tetratricopeptide (TPR) repeat protein|nr:hypothetical protein [Acidobacteriota bacterium]